MRIASLAAVAVMLCACRMGTSTFQVEPCHHESGPTHGLPPTVMARPPDASSSEYRMVGETRFAPYVVRATDGGLVLEAGERAVHYRCRGGNA